MSTTRPRTVSVLRAAAAVVLVPLVLLVAGAPTAPARASGAAGPLQHLGTEQVSERVQVVRLRTPALDGVTNVRVLLPEHYDPSGATRYPVLYIFHGATQNSSRWLEYGDVEAATAGQPLIVVMPDGGLFGFYTDWWNFGAGGAPMWETYHLDQLIPWIDATYPTIADRDGRAVAGESMGGLGALHYAATRPDLFTAAASFSGAIDTNHLLAPPIIEVAVMAEHLHLPAAAFGPRLTEEVRYRGHNPVDLAENLRGLLLQLDVGDGSIGGPLGATGVGGDPVELVMHEMNVTMHERLDALGIAHGFDAFPGCHCWPDWQRDLRELIPPLMDRFAHPVPPPSPFSYTSIHPRYGVYGWDVRIDRPALEFSRLADAGPGGFELTGSGSASVTTAALFAPGQPVVATVTTGSGPPRSRRLAAGDDGRLTVPVSLGPGNPFQQGSPAGNLLAAGNGGRWPSVTARVTLAPAEPAAMPVAPPAPTPDAPAPAPASLPTTGGSAPGPAAAGILVLALALLTGARLAGGVTPLVRGAGRVRRRGR